MKLVILSFLLTLFSQNLLASPCLVRSCTGGCTVAHSGGTCSISQAETACEAFCKFEVENCHSTWWHGIQCDEVGKISEDHDLYTSELEEAL